MKVLHILSSNKFSGAENVVLNIISGMQKIKFFYVSPKGEIENILNSQNINYQKLEKFSVKEINRAIKELKPDIIHTHDFTATVKVAIISSTPIIAHIHQSPSWLKRINLKSIIFLATTLKLKKIIWVNKDIQINKYMFNIINNKSEVLPNILEKDRIESMANTNIESRELYDLVFLGRLVDIKNPIRFIEIINKIKMKICDLKVVIIGSGNLEEECKKKVDEYGLNDTVCFKGFMENPLPILKSSKILVMTSKSEGTPISMLEAFLLEKPVVVSNIPTMKFVKNHKLGYVCNLDNEFVEKILELLDNKESYNEICKNIEKYLKLNNNTLSYYKKLEKIYSLK